MKAWRLVVTALGQGGIPLHEVTVDAENWMTALRQARAAIGEQGGVPTGASCAVSPDGKVTILDPVTRRSYVITPDSTQSFRPPAPAAAPRVPADVVPRAAPVPSAVPPAAPAAAATEAPQAVTSKPLVTAQTKVSKSTVAYQMPPEMQARLSAVGPVTVGAGPAQPHSIAPTASVVVSAPLPAVVIAAPTPEVVAAPAPVATPAEKTPAERAAARKAMSRTMAYMPPAAAGAAPGPQIAVGAPQAAQPSVVVAPQAAPAVPSVAPAAPSVPPPDAPLSAHLLSQRDEDPSPQSPLVYRERTWVVPPHTAEEAAAQALRGELYALQQTLSERPPGKFVNLAVFDHAWTDRPLRAPLVTVQWKDWRGDPELAFPARERASRGSGQMAVVADPAPAAPVAVRAAPSQPAPAPPAPEPAAPTPSTAGVRKRSTTGEATDDRLAHAFEACQDLFFLASPADGLDFAVRLLGEIVPCEAITGALYDINTDELRLVVLSGPGAEERRGEAVPSNAGLFAAATKLSGPLLIDDVASDRRFDPGVDGRIGVDAHTMLIHAVSHEARLLGLLQLVNRTGQPQFSRADGNVVTYVAKQLAAFLHTQRTADKRPPAGTTVRR